MLYCHVQKRPIISCFLPIRSVTSTQKGRLSKNPTKIQICARISSRLLLGSQVPLRNQLHNYMARTYRATNPITALQLVGHGNTTTNQDTKNQGTIPKVRKKNDQQTPNQETSRSNMLRPTNYKHIPFNHVDLCKWLKR